MSPSPHSVIFFERDEGLLAPLKEFAVQGLDAGERVIVIATAAHTAALVAALGSRRVGAPSADNFILFSADDAIDRVAPGGTVERERLFNWLGPFTEAGPCRIFGEMVSLLAARDQFEAAFDSSKPSATSSRTTTVSRSCAPMTCAIWPAPATRTIVPSPATT